MMGTLIYKIDKVQWLYAMSPAAGLVLRVTLADPEKHLPAQQSGAQPLEVWLNPNPTQNLSPIPSLSLSLNLNLGLN